MKDKLIKIIELINNELGETNELQVTKKSYIKSYQLFNNIKSPYYDNDFEISYDDSSKSFKLYTSYSNREVTDEWLNKAKEMQLIVNRINSILGVVDD